MEGVKMENEKADIAGPPPQQPARTPIGKLAAAIARAHGSINNAPVDSTNPHFNSKYASLAAVRDAVIPELAKQEVAVVQYTGVAGGWIVLHTALLHSSGEFLEGVYPVASALAKPQEIGSALTYARRYTLSAIGGIAAEEDDDGNSAQEAANKREAAEAKAVQVRRNKYIDRIVEYATAITAKTGQVVLEGSNVVDVEACGMFQQDPPVSVSSLSMHQMEKLGEYLKALRAK
jgi:hypothetical protein